jgi:hypothetical protein
MCWCCGSRKPEAQLLRLGARPEAAICLDCATHLRQRARAHSPKPVVRHLHKAANRIGGAVMHAGLHNRPIIGRTLRWLNRRSPV